MYTVGSATSKTRNRPLPEKRTQSKSGTIAIRLASFIVPLALIAAVAGVFWQGTGEPYPFETLRGETVMIRGYGLYRYDTVNSSSQEIATDIVTLLIGIPLLITGIFLSRQGSLRGQLLLTGALGYFLYTYGAMCFLTAFNPLFLVYVALFSLSLFGFILSISNLDVEEIARHISSGFPRRAVAAYFMIVAIFLTLAWIGLVASPSLTWSPPVGLESAITMVIQALDLGVIVPTSFITATLLFRKLPWGYALSSVLLLKILTMGAALIAMIIAQRLAGVPIDPITSTIFIIISLSGITLGIISLKNIR
ncbi:MAG TPA: hypothetical protein VFQ23_14020 [Anaerolineales bacterium]|nr:hypothetical protein [Anaerolineales bacterium]